MKKITFSLILSAVFSGAMFAQSIYEPQLPFQQDSGSYDPVEPMGLFPEFDTASDPFGPINPGTISTWTNSTGPVIYISYGLQAGGCQIYFDWYGNVTMKVGCVD